MDASLLATYLGDLLRGAVLTVSTDGRRAWPGDGDRAAGRPAAAVRPVPLRWAATFYVEFFRGIPVLLLLFFIYYGLPGIGGTSLALPFSLKLPALQAAILGFGLNYAAYEAEIYRAGIRSIPAGQWEAGRLAGHVAAATPSAASSCRRRSA